MQQPSVRKSQAVTVTRGTAASKVRVYVCAGWLNSASLGPASTFLPACITATASATYSTTPMVYGVPKCSHFS